MHTRVTILNFLIRVVFSAALTNAEILDFTEFICLSQKQDSRDYSNYL